MNSGPQKIKKRLCQSQVTTIATYEITIVPQTRPRVNMILCPSFTSPKYIDLSDVLIDAGYQRDSTAREEEK